MLSGSVRNAFCPVETLAARQGYMHAICSNTRPKFAHLPSSACDSVVSAEDKKEVFKDLSPAIDEARRANHELFNIKYKMGQLLEYAMGSVKAAYKLKSEPAADPKVSKTGLFISESRARFFPFTEY